MHYNMTVKYEYLNKANVVLNKCDNGSEGEEAVVRDCVVTLNLLKKSNILFGMAIEQTNRIMTMHTRKTIYDASIGTRYSNHIHA